MKRKVKIILSIIVAVILILIFSKDDQKLFVESSLVERTDIREIVSASGKIQPEIEIKISPDVSGEIVALPVLEGDKVSQGDLLVKIKPDIYKSILQRSQATLNTAKADLLRTKAQLVEHESNYYRNTKLYDIGAISLAEFERIESLYKVAKINVESSQYAVISAEASLQEAEENLQKTAIYAPVNGTISKLNVELGERVVGTGQMTGTEILRLANLEDMEVVVEVNENDIARVNINDTVQIEIDAFLGKSFQGTVSEIANSANISGVTADQVTNFQVKIRVLNQENLRPGMTATVDIETKKANNIIAVPIQAVTIRADTENLSNQIECVFLYREGEVVLSKVETGIQDVNNIEIISGIKEGDEVILGPYNLVSKVLENKTKVSRK
tara:strand:+ start:49 stop:1206 length:1158 start_codon:yes stop_codon:yes gene_type:complete